MSGKTEVKNMTQDSANVGDGCGTEKENTKTINCQNNEGSNPTPGANNILLDEHSPSGVLLAFSE